jgi:crotonobetainyl-CoA:carnitine CoA-transferase CaiB-like acyl-CoA transferase
MTRDTRAQVGPLSSLRVLDLSRVLAGPWAGQILADLGCDVIKVERPGSGDDTRAWGPPFVQDADGNDTAQSGYFVGVNRAKRSITVDIKDREGQQIIRALAERSDIVIENYKVGTLDRLGLGAADLRELNPGLIYCSITGFGQTGPRSHQPAYDFAIQALGGLMSVTGERDDRPGGGPQKVGVPIVDLTTGLYACVAILAAVARRAETGTGDVIDLAMLDVQVSLLANQAMNYLVSGRVPARSGNSHPNIQPQDVYDCSDGALAVAVGNDTQFTALCSVLDLRELPCDPRFARNRDRVANLPLLEAVLRERFASRARAHWAGLLDAAGVPCGAVNAIDEVFAEPQVRHRGMRVDVKDRNAASGLVPVVRSPLRFEDAALDIEQGPPALGEHTDEILTELGLDRSAIVGLRGRGVV